MGVALRNLRIGAAAAFGAVFALLATTAAFALCGAPAAFAQEAETATAEGEIIVTAQRRNERLQDVPIAVTALNAEQIESQGLQSTHDLAQAVTGMTITESVPADHVSMKLEFLEPFASTVTVGDVTAELVWDAGPFPDAQSAFHLHLTTAAGDTRRKIDRRTTGG